MQQAIFALSGDYGYINQIETTAKSIIYHHPGAKIYIINKDIPQEWFNNINNRIRPVKSQITNIKISDNLLKDEHVSQPQINEMSYGRILIPDLLDEDRVLYLDSDIIVDQNLDELFSMDMGDHPIAAIPDLIYDGNFNSGVLLFNMPILKADPQIVEKMLKAGNDSTLQEGDQSVLNNFFDDSYLHLPLKYNLAIGYDFLCFYYPAYDHNYWQKTSIQGKIIHFTSPSKPWNQLSMSRYREKWWQYHDLSWREVCEHAPLPSVIDYKEAGECFTMTNSENLKALEKLAQALPNWTFNVGAYTGMGGNLINLARYSNIHLFQSITGVLHEQLIQDADCYLDINYGIKDDDSLNRFLQTGKPIFSFDEVNSDIKDAANYRSFANDDLNGMVGAIKQLGADE
jgi:lipopolysaccharide biosynthesis glycosyltransferase